MSYITNTLNSPNIDSILEVTVVDKPINSRETHNIFDNMEAFAPPKAGDPHSEIGQYLATDVEKADDLLKW